MAMSAASPELLRWARAAAETLAERLRAGGFPRAERPALRRLLAEVFERLAASPPRVDHRLVRTLDGLVAPCPPFKLRPPRIGAWRELAVIDAALVARIFAREDVYEGITRRVERFLAVTGAADASPVRVRAPAEGDPLVMDFELTDG